MNQKAEPIAVLINSFGEQDRKGLLQNRRILASCWLRPEILNAMALPPGEFIPISGVPPIHPKK
jgi:hypothetical protein